MARRLLILIAASMLVVASACGTDDGDLSSGTSTTEESSESTATTEGDASDTTPSSEDDTTTTTDDDDASDTTVTTEGPSTTGTTIDDDPDEGDGSNPEFCAARTELEALFDGLDPEDLDAFTTAVDQADGTFDTYVSTVTEDLRDEAELVVEAVKDLGGVLGEIDPDAPGANEQAMNEFEALDTPELNEASDAVEAYSEQTCGE